MSRENSRTEYKLSQIIIAVIYLVLLGVLGIATAVAETTDRVSNSSHYSDGGRVRTQAPRESTDVYAPLETDGPRTKSPGVLAYSKTGSSATASQAASPDVWFYSADIILFGDDDIDGYYFGIDLLFDADTAWSAFDVYAVTYLSFEGGPWNEYAVTEDFTIFGSSGSDEYVLVTELMSGYPTGDYDLLIELFDTFDGAFLASYGPEETSALSFLPLEDFHRDAPVQEVVIIESHGGGGSLDGWLLGVLILFLLISASRKIWRHRNDALVRIDSPAPVWRTGPGSGR